MHLALILNTLKIKRIFNYYNQCKSPCLLLLWQCKTCKYQQCDQMKIRESTTRSTLGYYASVQGKRKSLSDPKMSKIAFRAELTTGGGCKSKFSAPNIDFLTIFASKTYSKPQFRPEKITFCSKNHFFKLILAQNPLLLESTTKVLQYYACYHVTLFPSNSTTVVPKVLRLVTLSISFNDCCWSCFKV